MPVLNGYLNVAEAAASLRLHPETVKRLCRSRRLAAEKVHNAWLIHVDQLNLFRSTYHENRGSASSGILLDCWQRGFCRPDFSLPSPRTIYVRQPIGGDVCIGAI